MSNTVRWFSRLSLNILNNNTKKQTVFNAARTIYTETSLCLDEYRNVRNIILTKYKSGIDIFKNKMKEVIANEKSIVFTEDLRVAIHTVEKTPGDLAMLVGLVNKYTNQSPEYHCETYIFGPIVMRTLHHLNEPDVAFEMFMNPATNDFFAQVTSSITFLDLLYENGMYSKVRQAYDKICANSPDNLIHHKFIVNIVAMSCYSENTLESLEYGLNVCKEMTNTNKKTTRKSISCLGALALKQNSPHITLELAEVYESTFYITTRCLKIMALADLDKINDLIVELKNNCKRQGVQKVYFYSDIISKIEGVIQRANLPEDSELPRLLNYIQAEGFIQQMTLDEHLSMPIQIHPKSTSRNQQRDSSNSKRPFYENRQQSEFQYYKQ